MDPSYYYLEMKEHYLNVPYYGSKRRIRVLLPRDYHESDDRYPVVYMHDGQNVFHSSEAFSGHSWKIIPTLKRNPDLPPMIIVAIDNSGTDRVDEYTPWSITNDAVPEGTSSGGLGKDYAKFVMEKVKPFIDEHYRTKSQAKYTAMAGSSLGGNITAFMGIEYKDEIGGLGVFSLANWITQPQFDRYIARHELKPHQRVYIQVGTKEGDATDRPFMQGSMRQGYIDTTLKYHHDLLAYGLPLENVSLNIITGDTHTESAWARQIPECLRFLSEEW